MEYTDRGQQFEWLHFYEAIANALHKYRTRRQELLDLIISLKMIKSPNCHYHIYMTKKMM